MPVERFYDFDDIRAQANCLKYATETLGLKPVKGTKDHFNCPWRNGSDSGGVWIGEKGFKDHVTDEKGDTIEFVARINHNGDIQGAQQELGDHYLLEPKKFMGKAEKKSRADYLLEKGYECTTTYNYCSLEGAVLHQVSRFEHPEHKKEFVQHTPKSPNIKGVQTVLYRLPDWYYAPWVCICAGEKDADNVAALGLPATTNASGENAEWEDSWCEALNGKNIAILTDNDEAGRQRGRYLSAKLKDYAQSIKVISFDELPEKGDATDFIEACTDPRKELVERIKQAEPIDLDSISSDVAGREEAKEKAKEANKYEFKNYMWVEGEESDKKKQAPRHINDLIKDIHTRFLGFPRRQGGILFDQDRETGRIVFFERSTQIFSWIQRKSQKRVRWGRIEGCVTKEELFEGLREEATQYEAISHVPDWPKREDVYYAHPDMPKANEDHRAFWKLVDFFNTYNPADRTLVAALLACPIYYEHAMQRPMFIIDSETRGAGKTTLATLVAKLYGHAPVEVKTRDLARDPQEITKRLVSQEGRQARVVLVDNITGTFYSEELASLATEWDVTGKPPYGRGEESRPNNLTIILTSNNAQVDDDLAIRSWYVKLRTPEQWSGGWKAALLGYVQNNRLQIFADLIDMLEAGKYQYGRTARTRCPEIELQVLQALCPKEDDYVQALQLIHDRRSESNVESEWGAQVDEQLRSELVGQGINPEQTSVFIRSKLATEWLAHALPEHNKNQLIQAARNLATQGHLPRVDSHRRVWPARGKARRRGILWMNANGDDPEISLDKKKDGVAVYGSDGDQITNWKAAAPDF